MKIILQYHSPALFIPVPANIFPTKLAPNVPYNILRNPPFCSFALFSFFSLTPYNNKPESSRDLTILIMSSISSFDIISVVVLLCKRWLCKRWLPDPKIFLCIPASAADAAAVNPRGIKTLLAKGLNIYFLAAVILFLVMGQEAYQEILLIVSSQIIEFFIT